MPILENLICVVNGNPDLYRDKYQGEYYTFAPGVETIIPLNAAMHFFGFSMDKEFVVSRAVRLGAHTDEELSAKLQWIDNFKFYQVKTKVERMEDEYVVIKPGDESVQVPDESPERLPQRPKRR